MKWYALNKEYVNYLKQFDSLVPNIDYTGRLKCFLGIIFKSDDGFDYFAPLTSYKPKFNFMHNDIDFYKIVDDNGRILGAIAINNMIPVPASEYFEVTKENLRFLRIFRNKRELNQYWKLLQKELSFIDECFIIHNAKKLFEFVTLNPYSRVAQRCCDFKLLEEKCREYIINKE
ncbi:MAG: type III toxin-antitoxin system ToxN/AbiQ family toxin [Erysipelotrichaceae bacterium]|nr:type III toxin-antitoxin system ToxN/AbiQ family toxin [Erysipelotrichaceae bacterium]